MLPTENYYARNRHTLRPYGDLDGSPAPVTVRRIDKSGLLEIAETDPITCPRPCVLTGAEDVAARGVSLRIDRSGLLESVPEAVDQPEDSDGATTKMLDEVMGVPRGETLKVDVDVNPRVFEGRCLLERPSSLEGQACPDEVDPRVQSADFKMLSGSPRAQLDVSKATERLPHLPFSPGLSLRRLRNDPSRRSPLTSRCVVDADSTCGPQNQKSPEFTASSASRKPADPSQSPITRERSQKGCAKNNVDAASTDSDVPAVDATKTPRESLLARGGAAREDDPPGEERAEAEGCEHTTVESLEQDEMSFKGSNKRLDNDSVQTLRVIILSEQL